MTATSALYHSVLQVLCIQSERSCAAGSRRNKFLPSSIDFRKFMSRKLKKRFVSVNHITSFLAVETFSKHALYNISVVNTLK